MKTSFVRARIEPKLKNDAEKALNEIGITPSQAVTMLYKHLAQNHSWPTPLQTPNAKNDTDNNTNLNKPGTFEKMCQKLGI